MNITADEINAVLAEKVVPDNLIADHDETGHYYRYVPTGIRYPSVTTQAGILDAPHLKKWAAGLAIDHIDKNWMVVSEQQGVKEDLRKAALMAHEDTLQDAGDIGTQGHNVIERYLLSWMRNNERPSDIRPFILGEDARLYAIARSAQEFCLDFEAEPIASEMFVVNEKEAYAGTLDALMFINRITKKGDGSCENQDDMFGGKGKPHEWWGNARTRKYKCKDCQAEMKKVFALVDWKTSNSVDKPEYAMQASAYWYALWRMTGLRPEEIIIVQLNKEKKKYQVVRVLDRVAAFRAFNHTAKVFNWLNDGQSKVVPYTIKKQVFLD